LKKYLNSTITAYFVEAVDCIYPLHQFITPKDNADAPKVEESFANNFRRATHQVTAENRPVLYHRVRNFLGKSNSLQWAKKLPLLTLSLLLEYLLPLSAWVIKLQN
jgi:hypothetical protein